MIPAAEAEIGQYLKGSHSEIGVVVDRVYNEEFKEWHYTIVDMYGDKLRLRWEKDGIFGPRTALIQDEEAFQYALDKRRTS